MDLRALARQGATRELRLYLHDHEPIWNTDSRVSKMQGEPRPPGLPPLPLESPSAVISGNEVSDFQQAFSALWRCQLLRCCRRAFVGTSLGGSLAQRCLLGGLDFTVAQLAATDLEQDVRHCLTLLSVLPLLAGLSTFTFGPESDSRGMCTSRAAESTRRKGWASCPFSPFFPLPRLLDCCDRRD